MRKITGLLGKIRTTYEVSQLPMSKIVYIIA